MLNKKNCLAWSEYIQKRRFQGLFLNFWKIYIDNIF